jgi:hypothetical protein
MADQPLTTGDPSPTLPDSAEQDIRMWLDLMGTCEKLVLAGLRREIGPEGDLKAAYRRWYAEQMEEHERTLLHMMAKFARRGGADAS